MVLESYAKYMDFRKTTNRGQQLLAQFTSQIKKIILSETQVSHGTEYHESCLLGCDQHSRGMRFLHLLTMKLGAADPFYIMEFSYQTIQHHLKKQSNFKRFHSSDISPQDKMCLPLLTAEHWLIVV